ncbi:MAG: 3-oxoacyl-[acyl-carrier-protein] reductase [Rhodothermaceae bacterium]|nr:3-oxoacyl-[acyl-carrier-protein] reductase [Rhodothermaceae bacterium]
MNLDLAGKTALVTGGTRGIGRAIVEALADAGAKVAFTYRSSSETAEALKADLEAKGVACLALQGDAADTAHAEETVQAVLDAWGSIDVLVNNAGITRDTLMIRMSEDDWDTVLETNLKSVFNFCKAAYRPMMKQRGGSIVNISSVVGVTGNPGQANYAASKAGMLGFSKSLARELGGRGVRVNVVAPGYIATDMTADLNEKAQEAMQGSIPLGRVGQPDDVAAAVVFLASDAGAYITGHTLHVDGGLAM